MDRQHIPSALLAMRPTPSKSNSLLLSFRLNYTLAVLRVFHEFSSNFYQSSVSPSNLFNSDQIKKLRLSNGYRNDWRTKLNWTFFCLLRLFSLLRGLITILFTRFSLWDGVSQAISQMFFLNLFCTIKEMKDYFEWIK